MRSSVQPITWPAGLCYKNLIGSVDVTTYAHASEGPPVANDGAELQHNAPRASGLASSPTPIAPYEGQCLTTSDDCRCSGAVAVYLAAFHLFEVGFR